MKLITKQTDYAVQALIATASVDGYVSSATLSRDHGIPLRFLRIILRKLTQGGFVVSREGASGGVKLAKSPTDIRLIDIVRLFQGKVQFLQCLFRKELCQKRLTCSLRKRLNQVEDLVASEFDKTTLSELINGNGKSRN